MIRVDVGLGNMSDRFWDTRLDILFLDRPNLDMELWFYRLHYCEVMEFAEITRLFF